LREEPGAVRRCDAAQPALAIRGAEPAAGSARRSGVRAVAALTGRPCWKFSRPAWLSALGVGLTGRPWWMFSRPAWLSALGVGLSHCPSGDGFATIVESRQPKVESREPKVESREPRAESRGPRA